MTPTIICSGFRRCGVYPFNPQAINCSISTENPEASLTRSSDEQMDEVNENGDENEQMDTENEVMENGDENTATEFSIEQEHLFRTRFKEGYDLLDPEYLHWLKINHPDSVQAVTSESSARVNENDTTLADEFSFVQPLSPLTMSESATFPNSSVLNSTAPESATKPVTATPCESVTYPDKTPPTHDSIKHDKTPMTATPCVSTVESPPTPESTKTPVTTPSRVSTVDPVATSLSLLRHP